MQQTRTRFGILLAQVDSWPELEKQAADVEAAGFDSLWVADQFANPFAETDWLEGWSCLAGLAVSTSRVRIGTLVTTIVYRHPGVIAKQAITVDHMSKGRLILGIGAGGMPSDHTMTGTPYWSARERQKRFEEFVAVVDTLLTTERSSYEGRYYPYDGAYISPLPLQRPRMPLLIAAHGPRGIKLAAERADTWNLFEPGAGLKGEEAAAAIKAKNAALDANAVAAGRDPGQIRRSLCCGFSASTSWSTSHEALADIAVYERAGINEFILNYSPSSGFLATDRLADEQIPSVFLRSPDDLRDFAAAVGLDGPPAAR